MTPVQIKAERVAFEKDRRRVGWDKHMLRRHAYGKTWVGEPANMPTYMDNWAEAQWLGWLARAEQATAALEAVVADAERYAWLGKSMWYVGPGNFYCDEAGGLQDCDDKNSSAKELDAAIDTARRAGAKGGV